MVQLFVGTYTQVLGHVHGIGEGIYTFDLDLATGKATPIAIIPKSLAGENPTFLAATHKSLYVANEMEDVDAENTKRTTGYTQAFKLLPTPSNPLAFQSKHAAHGGATCHVSVSPDEKIVAASNYNGGNFSLFPIEKDGGLAKPSQTVTYEDGNHVVPDRQEASHVHSVWWFEAENGTLCAYAIDVGNDCVQQFVVDRETKQSKPHPVCSKAVRPPGAGPRHLAIHGAKGMVYVLDEMRGMVGVHKLDKVTGAMSATSVQEISSLPADYTGKKEGADIHVSTCGKFVVASNRSHDSLVCYRILDDGKLELVGFTPTRGKCPRSSMIVGDLVLAANQDTHTIEVFKLNGATGELVFTGNSIACPSPVALCIPPTQ